MTAALRWGLIGASDIAATRMIPAMRRLRQVPAVVFSHDPQWGARFAARHGLPRVAGTLDETFTDVDAVYISSRNDQHAAQTLAAAAAGRHVLCEKPLALTLSDGIRMVDACREAGVVLATNHHLRNAATFRTMRRLVGEGAVGEPLAVRIHHAVGLPDRLRGWRLRAVPGAGVIMDITVHDVDTLRFVVEREVTQVAAQAVCQGLADGVEDAVMSVLRLDGDMLASTHDGFTTAHAGTGFEVHGREASLIGRNIMTQDPVGEVWLRRGSDVEPVDVGPYPDLYDVGLHAFASAVRGDGRPAASGADGLASLAVALAVAQASANGRTTTVERPALRATD